jgi:GH35 family endo-1,4-beta-xylanase
MSTVPNATLLKVKDLHFDYKNPRLAEYGIEEKTPETEILKILWDAMDVQELVQSIAASGFFPHETLIVAKENGKNIVIEGNRRLAAVKVLLHDRVAKDNDWEVPTLTQEARAQLEELPVIVSHRKDSWRYLGFKHVNGPAKWSSYAKAAYIAEVHRLYKIPLADIANQIGDRHNTVQRLYRGLNSKPSGSLQFTFSHLAPNTIYSIAGYGARDQSVFTTNTSTSAPTNPNNNALFSPFQCGVNYVLFKGTSDGSGNLVITVTGVPYVSGTSADGYSNVSGLSISPQVMGTTQLLPTTPSGFTFSGSSYGGYDSIQTVSSPSSFTQAHQVSTTSPTYTPSNVRIYATTSAPVTAGDALVAQVWYRRVDGQAPTGLPGNPAIQPNEASLVAVLDQFSGTLTSASIPLRGRTQWREVNVPFIASGTGFACFHVDCNGAAQVTQIGGISLIDYGQKSVLSSSNLADATPAFTLNNYGGTWGAVNKSFSTSGQPVPFSTCDQVTVNTAPGYAQAQQCNLSVNLTKAVAAGDTLIAILWLHRDASSNQANEGISGYQFVTQSNATSIPASSYPSLIVGPEPGGAWTQYYIPFTASQAYAETNPSNTGQFQIFFGAASQILDVGSIQLIDLGSSVSTSSLSNNQTTYPGRSNFNQYWRQLAQTNIQTYRMGNLKVNVLGYPTAPISGVSVSAAEVNSAFGWGSWANWGYITGNPGAGVASIPNYQSVFSRYSGNLPSTNWVFNQTTRGEMKWPIWEGEQETWTNSAPNQITGVTDWFLNNGVTKLRGHNLVWPNYYEKDGANYLDVPQDVPSLTGTTLSNRVICHIIAEAGCTTNSPVDEQVCGRINDWDVVNEPWVGRCIQGVLSGGDGLNTSSVTPAVSAPYLTTWLNETATVDPTPDRYINDNGIELNFARVTPASATTDEEEYDYELMTNVIAEGGAVTGMGFEGHYPANTAVTDPNVENAIFSRFGGLNTSSGPFQEQITEYDPQFSGQDMQADYMSDILTVAFSNPNFTAFTTYGFWGGDSPTANSAMIPGTSNYYGTIFNSDWSVSPSGEAYLGLVKGQWWTGNAAATSNSSGVATINGFCGRYAATASYGGVTKTYYCDMPTNAGATVNLQLDGSSGSHNVWVYDVANCRSIYPAFQRNVDSQAVNGKAVTAISGPDFAPPGESNGPAQLSIRTEAYGYVYIWFRSKLQGTGNSTIWVSLDNTGTIEALLSNTSTYHWGEPWGSKTFAPGSSHVINISPGSVGTVIDQVLITDDPSFTPTY